MNTQHLQYVVEIERTTIPSSPYKHERVRKENPHET